MNWILCVWLAVGLLLLGTGAILVVKLYLPRLVDRRIADYQNDLVSKHIDEVENIYQQMRGWRHDYHNHIQALKAYLTLGQTAEVTDYLGKLDADLAAVDTLVKAGNVMVDAILNSKLSLAKARGIAINAKATVPRSLSVSEIDLCVILGNLLDNAIEACLRLDAADQRFIRVYLGILKGQLYISVTNSAGGEVRKTGGRYLSTKDSPSHGFGLVRVDKIADKYCGYVNRQHEAGVFATEVLLPI